MKPPIFSPNDFSDILAVVKGLPLPDLGIEKAAKDHAANSGLAPFPADILAWLSKWQGRFPPRFDRPRIVMFASDHGVVNEKSETTRFEVDNILNGESEISELAKENDADLRLYELNLVNPTANFTSSPAMSEAECVGAIVYGMMAVEPDLDVISLSGFGQGSGASAGTVAHILGLDDAAESMMKCGEKPILKIASELHGAYAGDSLELLRRAGGREMAAALGVIIAARMAHTPVVIEGHAAIMSVALLHLVNPATVGHCFYVGNKASPAVTRLAANMGLLHVEVDGHSNEAGVQAATFLPLLRAAASAA